MLLFNHSKEVVNMKVIDIREIKGVQCGIIHITSNSLLRNGYYYVVKHNEVNQQLVFVIFILMKIIVTSFKWKVNKIVKKFNL